MATAGDVAQWLLHQLKEQRYLYQETVVDGIEAQFGEGFTYDNENGNRAIARPVLKAFTKLTGDEVVWERGEKCWRFREPHDAPGRQAD